MLQSQLPRDDVLIEMLLSFVEVTSDNASDTFMLCSRSHVGFFYPSLLAVAQCGGVRGRMSAGDLWLV